MYSSTSLSSLYFFSLMITHKHNSFLISLRNWISKTYLIAADWIFTINSLLFPLSTSLLAYIHHSVIMKIFALIQIHYLMDFFIYVSISRVMRFTQRKKFIRDAIIWHSNVFIGFFWPFSHFFGGNWKKLFRNAFKSHHNFETNAWKSVNSEHIQFEWYDFSECFFFWQEFFYAISSLQINLL